MKTKKQNDYIDIELMVTRAGRVLYDGDVDYLVVGIDGNGKLEATMSRYFGAAVESVKYKGKSEDGLFRLSRMTETLKMVADVVESGESEPPGFGTKANNLQRVTVK
jgi:hypothetical protein